MSLKAFRQNYFDCRSKVVLPQYSAFPTTFSVAGLQMRRKNSAWERSSVGRHFEDPGDSHRET